ncbi:MAG: HK97 family phage prohead protease [Alphaproteobacteria bacterium]|nr:HK97 family phage prohead protease [Alphaproteobacteria bacterium]
MDYAGSPFEIKQLSESGSIEGLLAGFGNVDSHGDVIGSKAFSRTLAERGGKPLPMLLHHDLRRPVGAWKEFQERGEGLYVKGSLSLQTRDAQEAYALAKDGALTGLSIGYRTKQAQLDRQTGENHLLDLDLIEGSLVTVPSNPNTHVSAIKAITSAGDIAELLKEAGVSGRKAKAAAGFAWKAINDSDDDAEAEAEIRAILNTSAARIAALGRN